MSIKLNNTHILDYDVFIDKANKYYNNMQVSLTYSVDSNNCKIITVKYVNETCILL